MMLDDTDRFLLSEQNGPVLLPLAKPPSVGAALVLV